MDAPCKIQRSIHVFRLVNNMCPGKWVHIKKGALFYNFFLQLGQAVIGQGFHLGSPRF